MALWGTKDTVYSTGKVDCNVTTGAVTRQAGAIAWTGVTVGDVITLADDGAGVGEGVILSIDDTGPGAGAKVTISTANLPDTNFTAVNYEVRSKPSYTIHDSHYASDEIYGVDTTEQGVANDASGDARKYAPPHAGWVGITTYNDLNGNLRVKTETLVAGSTISGDAENTVFPQS
tara:strand:- start:343 stop:867 length:525 start_codon:yes stop_codon:yes gene_type:complete